ncbi:putative retrotransposon gag domain-containing protein [Helianthus annuus]|nr:putative retrotransposon gag domain-containing protein [Helianthus annuus]
MIQSMGKIPLYNMGWSKFVDLIKETYCPQHEVEKVETYFLTHTMKNLDCRQYVTDFNSMSRLIPYLITPEHKRIARFIGGLAPEIKGMVKASKPATFRSLVDLSLSLTLDLVRRKLVKTKTDEKRKREEDDSHNSKKKGKFEFNRNQQDSNKKPTRKICNRRHWGQCRSNQKPKQCGICKRTGHQSH